MASRKGGGRFVHSGEFIPTQKPTQPTALEEDESQASHAKDKEDIESGGRARGVHPAQEGEGGNKKNQEEQQSEDEDDDSDGDPIDATMSSKDKSNSKKQIERRRTGTVPHGFGNSSAARPRSLPMNLPTAATNATPTPQQPQQQATAPITQSPIIPDQTPQKGDEGSTTSRPMPELGQGWKMDERPAGDTTIPSSMSSSASTSADATPTGGTAAGAVPAAAGGDPMAAAAALADAIAASAAAAAASAGAAGAMTVHFISPGGYRFTSRDQVTKFKQCLLRCGNDERQAYMMLRTQEKNQNEAKAARARERAAAQERAAAAAAIAAQERDAAAAAVAAQERDAAAAAALERQERAAAAAAAAQAGKKKSPAEIAARDAARAAAGYVPPPSPGAAPPPPPAARAAPPPPPAGSAGAAAARDAARAAVGYVPPSNSRDAARAAAGYSPPLAGPAAAAAAQAKSKNKKTRRSSKKKKNKRQQPVLPTAANAPPRAYAPMPPLGGDDVEEDVVDDHPALVAMRTDDTLQEIIRKERARAAALSAKTAAAAAAAVEPQAPPPLGRAVGLVDTPPTSPTAAIPLGRAHPSPGTPMPPLPGGSVEEMDGTSASLPRALPAMTALQPLPTGQHDAVLDNAIATANQAASEKERLQAEARRAAGYVPPPGFEGGPVASRKDTQTAGEAHREDEDRQMSMDVDNDGGQVADDNDEGKDDGDKDDIGDDRTTDFKHAVDGEQINPPSQEGARKRGLAKTTGLDPVVVAAIEAEEHERKRHHQLQQVQGKGVEQPKESEGAKEPPQKKGGRQPKEKKKHASTLQPTPHHELMAGATSEVNGEDSERPKKKRAKKKKPPMHPRSAPRRNRTAPTHYSDDRPGTVTFEEQFGDGKHKDGEKEWIQDPSTSEWRVGKLSALEGSAADDEGCEDEIEVAVDDDQDDAQKPKPHNKKRRGRPPKSKPTPEAVSEVVAPLAAEEIEQPPQKKKKKLGRPPKARAANNIEAGKGSEMAGDVAQQKSPPRTKRSRPSRTPIDQAEEKKDEEAEPPKKRRGRPSNKQSAPAVAAVADVEQNDGHDEEAEEAVGAAASQPAAKKNKRGRPKGSGNRNKGGDRPLSINVPPQVPPRANRGEESASAGASASSATSRSQAGRARGGARAAQQPAAAAAAAAQNEAGEDDEDEDVDENADHQLTPRGTPKNAQNLFMAREGKNAYFRVELLLGGQNERTKMLPFSQVQLEDGDLSIDSYVAPEGEPFAIRVKLARPRTEGATYGGRVFIDTPCCHNHDGEDEGNGHSHDCHRSRNSAVNRQLKTGDDHFFWIGPGETEYIIEGFYTSRNTSSQFVFKAPPARLNLDVGVEDDPEARRDRLMSVWRSIGGIRIAFSLVRDFRNRDEHGRKHRKPKQAAIDTDSHIDRKGKCLSAHPGAPVEDQIQGMTDQEAILCDEAIFEKRIAYNTFGGYKADNEMQKHVNSVDLYKALPLEVLKQMDVRKQCVNVFVNKVPLDQMDESFNNLLEETYNQNRPLSPTQAGESSEEGARAAAAAAAASAPCASGSTAFVDASPKEWIKVADVVKSICRTLSPAASYIICTGKEKEAAAEEGGEKNYGERIVQNTLATEEEKMQDMEYKLTKLTDYFLMDPFLPYEIRQAKDEQTGEKYYKLRKDIVDLTVSDDSDCE